MQSNKKAIAECSWYPCNYILLKDRHMISTKRPADHSLKHALSKNSYDNIIYSKITDDDMCDSKIDNNYKEIKTKEASLYLDKHELINNEKSTCEDEKVKTDKISNISQEHVQKCLTWIFQCNINMESAHH